MYQYAVMPFRVKNSPATSQRLINKVIAGLHGCKVYIDNAVTYSDTWEEHSQIIQKFSERLTTVHLHKQK